MYTIARCDKCGNYGLLETRNLSKEKVDSFLKEMQFGECKFGGFHVEIGSMADYISVDYNRRFDNKNEANKELKKIKEEADAIA